MGSDDCGYAPEHPIIERRLRSLEEWREHVMEARVEDMKHLNLQLGQVHDKVNTVAQRMEKLNGKLLMFGIFTTAAGALLMLILNQLFNLFHAAPR